jgi:hypothetical protein
MKPGTMMKMGWMMKHKWGPAATGLTGRSSWQ